MKQSKPGKITPNGVSLEKHENDIVVFFTNLGKNIELIPPSLTPGTKTADFIMDGLIWEAKSPQGKSKYLIRDTLRRASTQSPNIIIDLHRAKLHQAKCLNDLQKFFTSAKNILNLKVITKDNQLIDFTRTK